MMESPQLHVLSLVRSVHSHARLDSATTIAISRARVLSAILGSLVATSLWGNVNCAPLENMKVVGLRSIALACTKKDRNTYSKPVPLPRALRAIVKA